MTAIVGRDAVRRHRPRRRAAGPTTTPTDAVRACLVAAVVVRPARSGRRVRRIVAWSGHVVYGSEGPRRELLDQFAHGLTRATALDDVLRAARRDGPPGLRRRRRRGVAAPRRRAGARPVARPVQRAEPVAARRRPGPPPIARAGVSGDGWAASWLPELRRDDDHLRVAPLAVQGELLGVLVARRRHRRRRLRRRRRRGPGARRAPRRRRPAERRARRRAAAHRRRAAPQQRRPARSRGPASSPSPTTNGGASSATSTTAPSRTSWASPSRSSWPRALVAADPAGAAAVLDRDRARPRRPPTPSCASLAHGIFPPLLLTGGLRDAIAGIAAHAPVHVEVGVVTGDRFDRQVEAAVYFCCAEAVQNAAKHAGAAPT